MIKLNIFLISFALLSTDLAVEAPMLLDTFVAYVTAVIVTSVVYTISSLIKKVRHIGEAIR